MTGAFPKALAGFHPWMRAKPPDQVSGGLATESKVREAALASGVSLARAKGAYQIAAQARTVRFPSVPCETISSMREDV